jgi:hypothetical protein
VPYPKKIETVKKRFPLQLQSNAEVSSAKGL